MSISKKTILEFIGEFIATFILAIFLYTTPIVASGIEPFVIAFLVMALWHMFSSITKVQMNPAVTLGEYIVVLIRSIFSKKFNLPDLFKFIGYIVTQLLAFFAAFPLAAWIRLQVVNYLMETNSYGTTDAVRDQLITSYTFANSYPENFASFAFVLEMLMAFLVVFTFIRVTSSEKTKQYAGFIWGLVIFGAMIMASQITGASFNPWRSLVASIIEGGDNAAQVGLYVLAPFVGAFMAGLLQAVLAWFEKPSDSKPVVKAKVSAPAPKKAVKAKKAKKK